MYPPDLVAPMKTELSSKGFKELTTPEAVDELLGKKEGTVLVVVNSVCGCAARNARPGAVKAIMESEHTPDTWATVFAGVDGAATQKAREYFLPYPPSSPSMALFKDGELVHFLERHHIEGADATAIAHNLSIAFEEYCK